MTLPGRPIGRLRLRHTFAALGYRNYRLWFAGQSLSLLGTWMQMTAQAYLVFELTGSAAYLGYVAFAFGIPPWLFMLYGGVIADRVSRRKLLIVTQGCMMGLAVLLATITFLGVVAPWHLVGLAFLSGTANAFDAPARQAIILELVDREDLTNAIALNSTMFNMATAVGPAVAGILYVEAGPGWCFAVNSMSYIAVLIALLLIRPKPQTLSGRGSGFSAFRQGLGFVLSDRHVRTLVALVMVMGLFGLTYATLMPAWAVRVLGGDATTNGFLQSARGVGALVGALVIASLGRFDFRGRLLTAATFAFPLAVLIFARMEILALALVALGLVGICLIATMNLCNSLVQTLTPNHLRGRVMSIYSLAFFGFMPIGGLLAGAVAEHVGERLTVIAGATLVLGFATAARLLVPSLRELP